MSSSPEVDDRTDNVVPTEGNALVVKHALPCELDFYQTVAADSELDALRPFIPKFLGTLEPEAPSSETSISVKPLWGARKESLVLENLSYPFLKPNILDIKLGTVQHDESMSPEKVKRMLKTTAATTSLKTGIRLTGSQVYDNTTGEPISTSKGYGRSISAAQLPEGFARFFPVVTADAPAQGLPPPLLLHILTLLRKDVQDIRDAFAALEMRMVGGSLLFLYESDAARAEEGLKWTLRDEEEEGEDEEEEEESSKHPKPSPCDVRLIDFAHTRFVPGQGPDEGVLLGLNTVLWLLDERIAEIKKCSTH